MAEPQAKLLVGVGASAGGVEALSGLVGHLVPEIDAAVLVVLHMPPAGTSVLSQILDRSGPLPAVVAADGMVPCAGHVYVAPPDRHLLMADGALALSAGPRENGHRPAIDPMLRSLAALGDRAVGVILSGTRDDGTAGLARLKAAGGTALLQDPTEAAYDGMIRSALTQVAVDGVLPVAQLATRIATISSGRSEMLEQPTQPDPPDEQRAASTRYTCPECGGHISAGEDEGVLRYTCEVGHAYSPESMDDEQGVVVEQALWKATRLLGDRATLLEDMAGRADTAGHGHNADGFRRRAGEAREASDAVRSLLVEGRVPTAGGANA